MTAIREHILLTVLGANPRLTTYEWGGRTAEAAVAPAALYSLPAEADRPDRILALCTPEAEQVTLPKLTESLDTRLCPIDTVAISSEPTDDTIQRCLAELVKHVPPGVNLTVDVTHGFRHLAFVAYAGVLYLTALRDVRLRAAYYGLLRDPEDGSSRFFDLRPLVELPRWYHAVQVLKDTGSAHAMAGLVDESAAAGELGTVLRTISEAYASGYRSSWVTPPSSSSPRITIRWWTCFIGSGCRWPTCW